MDRPKECDQHTQRTNQGNSSSPQKPLESGLKVHSILTYSSLPWRSLLQSCLLLFLDPIYVHWRANIADIRSAGTEEPHGLSQPVRKIPKCIAKWTRWLMATMSRLPGWIRQMANYDLKTRHLQLESLHMVMDYICQIVRFTSWLCYYMLDYYPQ